MNSRNKDIFRESGGYNPQLRDKYIQMPLNEKRNLYKCGDSFVTLNSVDNLKNYKTKSNITHTRQSAVNLANVPILEYKEAQLFGDKVSLWQGDITKLEIDAIVNAANESLLGGGGVDGAIHSAASSLLVKECKTLRGCPTGQAKITSGYNLPAKYVIHTVGPTNKSEELLRSCYNSSLNLVKSNKLTSVAFPCIATGIYGYPNEAAAKTAIDTVTQFLRSDYGAMVERIIFTVFLDKDLFIYESLLNTYFKSIFNT